MPSPDASMVRAERWQAFSPEQRRGCPPLCPDLVVELVSPRVAAGFCGGVAGLPGSEALRRKMATDIANGAQLGWLLVPEQRAVRIWQVDGAGGEPGRQCQEAPMRLVAARVWRRPCVWRQPGAWRVVRQKV